MADKIKTIQHAKDIGAIANHAKFAEALGDLAEDEAAGGKGAVAQAMDDPHGFFEKRGVAIPRLAKVTVEVHSPLRLTVCLNGFCVSWQF